MKNLIKYLSLCFVAVFAVSCEKDANNTIDQVVDGVTSGAVLRVIEVFQNEMTNEDLDGGLSFQMEEQDAEEGGLLQEVNIYVQFSDNSPGINDNPAAITEEQLYLNLQPEDFTDASPFGLPRVSINITAEQFLDFTNNTLDDIFGRDTFTTRLELLLTDGRVFSVDNAGGIITGGFFNSPFQFVTNVISPIGPDQFIGPYTVENNTPGVLNFNVFEEGATVELYQPEGGSSVERAFDFVYLPDAGVGQPAESFNMLFIVDAVEVVEEGSNLTCGGGLTRGAAPDESFGSFDLLDDSVFTVRFTDNLDSDCGEEPRNVQATFTKQ